MRPSENFSLRCLGDWPIVGYRAIFPPIGQLRFTEDARAAVQHQICRLVCSNRLHTPIGMLMGSLPFASRDALLVDRCSFYLRRINSLESIQVSEKVKNF